jgi:hypothetical protein
MGQTLLVILLAGFALAGLAPSTAAQDLKVAEEELKGRDYAGIEFENYSGPYQAIDPAEAIRAIGHLLAADLERRGAAGRYLLRYSVIRAVDPSRPDGLDADILSIDREARVDHIDNVRRIVAGYLEAAWSYSPEDARLLAVFATLYNAVYRGRLDYFAAHYKPVVLDHLDRENAGLSTRYTDWPGATRLVIPLAGAARKGSLGSLSTAELTEKTVIEQLRLQPDKGLEDRKEMVELRERELEEKKGELEERKEALAGEERRLAEETAGGRPQVPARGDADVPREPGMAGAAALDARRTGTGTASAGPASGGTAAGGEAAAGTAPAAGPDRGPAEREREERELAARREALGREQAETARQESALREQEKRIEEERRQIVEDERAMPLPAGGAATRPEGAAFYSDKLYYLWVRESGSDGGATGEDETPAIRRTLYVLDPFRAGVFRTSPVAHVASPGYWFFQDGVLVVARHPQPAAPARLALLHPATLEPLRWSEAEVHPEGMVFLQAESLYTFVRHEGAWRLGRFDRELALAARSQEAVRPDSFLASFGGRIYVTDPQGRVQALDGRSLERQALIEQP